MVADDDGHHSMSFLDCNLDLFCVDTMPTVLVATAATIDVTDVMYLTCAAYRAAVVSIVPVLCKEIARNAQNW